VVLELLLDVPLADLSTPLCPRQAPFVVVTVTDVPSLHCSVILAGAAACAYTPGAAISAAAITAINPNDFIVIPSSMKTPIQEARRPR